MKRRTVMPKVRAKVLDAGDMVCFYCGAVATVVDHIVPVALGGSDAPENLIAACRLCNQCKAAGALGSEVVARALACAGKRAAKVRENIIRAERQKKVGPHPVTPADFRKSLSTLGLTQAAFRREVETLGGEPISKRTVENWANGERPIPPLLPALLRLMVERHVAMG